MMSNRKKTVRYGLSLIETTVATVLVSITLVASLNALAFVLIATDRDSQSQRASEIAQVILAEIASRPFLDPSNTSTNIGLDASETSNRTTWDDCDDYHNWTVATITHRNGQALAGAAGWSLQVNVSYCDPTNPSLTVGSPTGLKRIVLRLHSPSARLFNFYSLRSDRGVLTGAQIAGSSVLSNVDISLRSATKSLTSSTRVHNQQVPN